MAETVNCRAAIELAILAVAWEKAHAVYFPDSAREMAGLASAFLVDNGILCWISPAGDSITCAACRNTSRNPNDVATRYCGFCHTFYSGCWHSA
jgi:hypothetical protein